MNKEVNDALHMLLHCALKDKEFETQKEQFEIVYEHIEKLQEKINTYEEPEDLTLMFMYCEEKAKDKIKELHNKIDKLLNENQSLRTRIKTIKRRRKHQTQKKNKYKSIVTEFQKALEKKNNKIDKAIEYIEETSIYTKSHYDFKEDLLEILEG